MTESEMLDINLEVKMGTHRKGDPYPVLNFGKFQYQGDWYKHSSQRMIVCQAQVPETIDELHRSKPQGETVTFFYLAEADTVESL